jgi:hypothetical protein
MAKVPPARSVLLDDGSWSDSSIVDLEARLFRSLRMPNGTFKTTAAGRLVEFDVLVAGMLGEARQVQVLDVGVASGVTTVDLANQLQSAGYDPHVIGIDLFLNADVVRVAPLLDVLLTPGGDVLQVSGGPVVMAVPHDAGTVLRRAKSFLMRRAGTLARLCPDSRRSRVLLVSRRARRDQRISFVEADALGAVPSWCGTFDLVRAANVLNLAYFPSTVLRDAIAVLASYLKPGGLLAVCRTDEEQDRHNGTVYMLASGKLKPLASLGSGSEISEIVETVRLVE